MRVDSGLEESAASNYRKIAKAVGNMKSHGVNMSLIDINRSDYMFEPDEENDTILYGLKGLNGVGGEVVQEIMANRPYSGLNDFLEKTNFNKTVVTSLIKSGAFDQFGERKDIMQQYLWRVCEPKEKLNMQNFNSLLEKGLLPQELDLQRRMFVFNKAFKKSCASGQELTLNQGAYYDFYSKFFDMDEVHACGDGIAVSQKSWKRQYDQMMQPAKDYIQEHQEELVKQYNDKLFQEMWDKYAAGSYSAWEMESLGFYYHEHELAHVNVKAYGVKDYSDLPPEPQVEYTFKRGDVEIPIYRTCRIIGTAIAKDDIKSLATILVPDGTVVDIKFNRDYYAEYNRRISEVRPDGTKKIQENGWFQKGTLLVVNGFRRGDTFVAKSYRNTPSHQLYKILDVKDDGMLEMTNLRWGEEE